MRCFLEWTPEYFNLYACMHDIYGLLNDEQKGILDSYCAYIAEHCYRTPDSTDKDIVFMQKEE